MSTVYCPCCGVEVPFSIFCKQVAKRKFNRRILIEIIQRERILTTGELARKYQEESGQAISLRVLCNVLKEFRYQTLVKTKWISKGRYGATTEILPLNKTSQGHKGCLEGSKK